MRKKGREGMQKEVQLTAMASSSSEKDHQQTTGAYDGSDNVFHVYVLNHSNIPAMGKKGKEGRQEAVQLTAVVSSSSEKDHQRTTGADDGSDNGDVFGRLPYREGILIRHQDQVGVDIASVGDDGNYVNSQRYVSDSRLFGKKKKFLQSIQRKDLSTVQHELEKDPTLTMYEDEHGVSALSVAVKGGPELIDTFLEKISDKFKLAVWIEHALLYAISADNYDAVKHLLDHRDRLVEDEIRIKTQLPKTHESRQKSKNYTKKNEMTAWSNRHMSTYTAKEFEDAEFPIYLTPVVLAAKLRRVDIIQLLQERGASEIHPVTEQCSIAADKNSQSQQGTDNCEICKDWRTCKTKLHVEECKRLIEVYKALSSPIYIFNSCVDDPVLEAFELSDKASALAVKDASFKAEYEQISKNCKEFACDLLDLCRSTEEIKTMLSITNGVKEVNSYANEDTLPRILVALAYGQKEFITHPSCQQVMHQKWFKGLPDWVDETESSFKFGIYILLWCLCWPFACFLFMIKICPWVITIMKHPINKFISDTISFAIFLILLVIECFHNRADQRARDWFTVTEYMIIVWISGMIARQAKMMYRHHSHSSRKAGLIPLFRRIWRWYDLLLLSCFLIWWALYVVGMIIMYIRGNEDLPRHQWEWWNLILLSEGVFSLCTLLSFLKFLSIFKTNSSIGPLLISLKLMLNDIFCFLVIYFFIIFGFIVGIINLYQLNDLNEIIKALKMLFWALFGYGAPEAMDSVVDNNKLVGNETEQTGDMVYRHQVTELCGSILFGSYHIVAIIVLINMLIAMMARTYKVIEANADMEWKYARTKQRMMYFSEVGSLPPPLNIMLIGTVMKKVLACCTKCSSWCKKKYDPKMYKPNRDYKALMKKLSKRYFNSKLPKEIEEENMHP